MKKSFHRALNFMALFTALVVAGCIYFNAEFLQIATSNVILNGIIIGTTVFGVGLCFYQIFVLVPEYKWLKFYVAGQRNLKLPPVLLRPVAQILSERPRRISAGALNSMLDIILMRFDDLRESIRYVTNTLIFLGLLGTFWGLILTVGGFAELIGGLDFSNEMVLESMQAGLSVPLSGMATAFTSSLLGLGGSLIVGFLAMQVQYAQNSVFRELEDFLAKHTRVAQVIPQINLNEQEIVTAPVLSEDNLEVF